jgi:hypothetical protein
MHHPGGLRRPDDRADVTPGEDPLHGDRVGPVLGQVLHQAALQRGGQPLARSPGIGCRCGPRPPAAGRGRAPGVALDHADPAPGQAGVDPEHTHAIGSLVGPNVCSDSLATNIDTWILKTYADTPYVYGPIRSIASLVYAVFMLFYGGLLAVYGYILMLWFGLAFISVSMILIISLPDAPMRPKAETAAAGNKPHIGGNFILMLAAMFISGVALTPASSMIAVTLKALHGGASQQAYYLCVHAFFEFPMMLLTYKLAQFISPSKRLFISSAMYAAAFIYILAVRTPQALIASSVLLGLAFGLFLPAQREFTFEIATRGHENSMQAATDTIGNNLSAALGSAVTGKITDSYGIFVLLCGAMILHCVSTALFFLLSAFQRHTRADINS